MTNNTKLALAAIEKLENSGFDFDIIFLFNGRESKPMVPAYCIDETFRLNLIKYNSMGAVGYVITSRAMKTLLDEYPLLAMGIDELMHWNWVTGLKTYIITPQVVFHDSYNHSYSGECLNYHLMNIWKNENPIKFAKYKIKRRFQRTQRIPSKIFLQSIPKRLVFRKRMKNEVL